MRHLVSFMVALLPAAALAQGWTPLRGLGTVPDGVMSQASDVSRSGVAVGVGLDALGNYLAWQWTEAGGMQRLPTPADALWAEANGVNDSGLVAGSVVSLGGPFGVQSLAVVWDASGFMTPVPLGEDVSWAVVRGLNERGDVIGQARGVDAGGVSFMRAVMWADGQEIDLGTLPGGDYADVAAINAHRQVVGASTTMTPAGLQSHAFVWSAADGMQPLGTLPGGDVSSATGIDDAGTVAGWSNTLVDGALVHRGFTWTRTGGFTVLEPLAGGTSSQALGIDARTGDVVGASDDHLGRLQAVVWDRDGRVTSIGRFAASQYARAVAIAGGYVVGDGDGFNESQLPVAFLVEREGGEEVPEAPVADAGDDVSLACSAQLNEVTLVAAGAYQAGDVLTWHLNGVPVASVVAPQVATKVLLPVGRHVLHLVATRQGVESAPDAVTVVVTDTQAPVSTYAASPAANEFGWHNDAVLVDLAASDVCSSVAWLQYAINEGAPVRSEGAEASFALDGDGEWRITRQAQDAAGNVEAPHAPELVRIDTTPPVVTARVTPEPNENGWWSSAVTVVFEAIDALSGVREVSDPVQLRSSGEHDPVEGEAWDFAGNRGTTVVSGIRIDAQPPVVEVDEPACGGMLWPPNHKMVAVTVAGRLTDDVPVTGGELKVSIASSEPDDARGGGDGNTSGDTNFGDGHRQPVTFTRTLNADGTFSFPVFLRAERAGGGNGRTYTVTVTGTDGVGHEASARLTWRVPKSMGHGFTCGGEDVDDDHDPRDDDCDRHKKKDKHDGKKGGGRH